MHELGSLRAGGSDPCTGEYRAVDAIIMMGRRPSTFVIRSVGKVVEVEIIQDQVIDLNGHLGQKTYLGLPPDEMTVDNGTQQVLCDE